MPLSHIADSTASTRRYTAPRRRATVALRVVLPTPGRPPKTTSMRRVCRSRRQGYGAGVQIGFAIPVSGSWATPDNVLHVAARADELGYSTLWTFQRLLSPVDGSWGEMYRAVTDPMVTLGYAAAITTRIRLGVA